MIRKIRVEEGLEVIQFNPDQSLKKQISIEKNTIAFLYSTNSKCGLEWPDHGKHCVLDPIKILVYSYPLKDTLLHLDLGEQSLTYLLKISISRLHHFFGSSFGDNADEVQSFAGSFRVRNLYTEKPVTPAISVIFHQIFNHEVDGALARLYFQGKVMEFLSHYMRQPKVDENVSLNCTFVNDHFEMQKINEARDLIIQNLESPPNLRDLARMVGTNEFKLKVGFKSKFGNTVYGYLKEFRMDKARHLLEQKTYSVKEVSHIVGYSNPSHFIAAYKKKFGITPKKHLRSVN